MTAIKYWPGDWNAVLRGGVLIVLPADTEPGILQRTWDSLSAESSLQQVLAAVTSQFANGIANLPDFAVVQFGKAVHAVLRGPLELRAQTPDAPVVVSGQGMMTWTERYLPGQLSFDVRCDNADNATYDADAWLPLGEGVVRVGRVAVGDAAEAPVVPEVPEVPVVPVVPEVEPVEAPAAREAPDLYKPVQRVEPVEQPSAQTLIDSVPWLRKSPTQPDLNPNLESTRIPEREIDDSDDVDDSTIASSAGISAPAPVQAPAPAPTAPPAHTAAASGGGAVPAVVPQSSVPPSPADYEDHDGHTVMRSELDVDDRTLAKPPAPAAAPTAPATGPTVLAKQCPSGHANPPILAKCSVCGAPLAHEPRQLRRPSLGKIRMMSGEVIDLVRPVIIGRQPSAARVQGPDMPRLVQVQSPHGDVSRSHVQIRLVGWDVLLEDLKSTNGTVLIRPGQPPRRLGQGDSALVLDGDIADLGDDVSIRFEGII